MNSVSAVARDTFSASVRLLNQPVVKEGVKKVAGVVTFAFGFVEAYDIYQILNGREISTEDYSEYPQWVQVVNKVIIICAKISLILSAGVSRPGVFIISSIVGYFFSTEQLNRVFGPNTIFKINPWHPRHVVSVAAVIFALPSMAQSACQTIHWTYKKIREYGDIDISIDEKPWLTDYKLKLLVLFNTLTSRPVLHLGNQWAA